MPNNTATILIVSCDIAYEKYWLVKNLNIINDVQQEILNHFINLNDIDKFKNDIKSEDIIDFEKLYPPTDDAIFWRTNHWGTKWSPYNIGEWQDDYNKSSIYYETAWDPATKFYLYVSKLYPTLTFTQKYADEGGSYIGYNIIHQGNVVDEQSYNWTSIEAIKLREELGIEEYDELDGIEEYSF